MKLAPVALSALLFSTYSNADTVELSLFSDIVGLGYKANINNAYSANVDFTHSQYDNLDSNLFKGGFIAKGVRDNLTGYVGLEPFWLNTEHTDTYGLSIGGGAKYLITPEFWAAGDIYYAPDIIVGGDYDNYYNFSAKIGYNVLPHASVYLGYQTYGGKFAGKNREMYNGIKLGINFKLR